MATQVFLHDTVATTHRGTNTAGLNGVTSGWLPKATGTTRGAGVVSKATSTVAGPTNGIETTNGAGGTRLEWITPPVDADVTIAGTITANIWSNESANNANTAINFYIDKMAAATGTLTRIVTSVRTTELSTSNAAVNFTATPTSTAVNKGDRLVISTFGNDSASNMGSGFTFTTTYAGTTGAASGDTYISFTETFGFQTTDPGIGSATITQDSTSGGANGVWGATGSSEKLAQSFTLASTTMLGGADLWMDKVGTPTDNLILDVVASLDGSVLATGTVAATSVPGSAAYVRFSFVPESFAAGTYYLQLSRSGVRSTSNYCQWYLTTANPYAGGSVWVRASGSWSNNATWDNRFILYDSTTALYLTDTASDVTTADVDREAWTSRGGSASNDVTNTTAGWVAPVQVTDTAGGTAVSWFTKPLEAFTLSGLAKVNRRVLVSSASANASIGVEIARVDEDGTNASVWGYANRDAATTSGSAGEVALSETAYTCYVSGDDLAFTDGQRIRVRLFHDDCADVPLVTGHTLTSYYGGPTGGASGDTYLILGQTLTEFATSGDIAASPATVAAVATVPAPTVLGTAVTAPSTVAAVATVPAPTLRSDRVATPATVAAVAVVPSPTVLAAAAATPTTVAAVATVPASTDIGTAVVAPATVAAVATVPAPTIQTGIAATPATVAATVSIPSVGAGGYDTIVVADAPMAYWPLNDPSGTTAQDGTANNRDLTYDAGVNLLATGPGGAFAAEFDGIPQKITRTDDPDFDGLASVSVEAWVYFDVLSGGTGSNSQMVIHKFNSGAGDGWFLSRQSSGDIRWTTGGSDRDDFDVAWVPNTGQWYHVVGTFSGPNDRKRIYIDSTQVGGDHTWTGTITANIADIQLGNFTNDLFQLDGRLARVAVYDFELSATQVSTHYAASTSTASVLGTAVASPSTVAAVATVPAPTIVLAGNATAAPSTVAAVASVPAPTVLAAAVATPTTVAAPAAVNAPTVQGTAVTAPATVVATASIPAPTTRAAALVAPTTVSAIATVPAPTVTGTTGATATPATVSAVGTVPAPTVTGTAIVAPTTVAATATVPAPTIGVEGNTTASPATVAVVATVPAPTVLAASITAPATVAVVATVNAPTVRGTATAAPSTVAATASVSAPTARGAVITAPATVAATAAVSAPTVTGTAVVTPATVAVVATVPPPAIVVGGNATALPATVTATASVPAPTVTGTSVTAPATVAATTAVNAPSLRSDRIATPAVVAVTATVPAPQARGAALTTPSTVAAVASVPAPATAGTARATPTTVAATASITGTAASGAIATTATVAAVASVGSPTVRGAAIATPSTVAATATVPAPTIGAVAATTATPTTVAVVATVPAPQARGAALTVTATVTAVASVGTPVVIGGYVTTPATVVAVAAIGSPTVTTTATATPATVGAVVTVPLPNVFLIPPGDWVPDPTGARDRSGTPNRFGTREGTTRVLVRVGTNSTENR